VTVPFFVTIFYSIFTFHKKLDNEGVPHGKFSDLWLTVFSACIWHFIKTNWEYNVWLKILPYVEDKHQDIERIHRAKRISKWFFDVLHYSFFACFAFIAFYPIMPTLLFGEQPCWDAFKGYPYPTSSQLPWVKEYYLIQLGCLLQKIVDQLVKKRNDVKFWEYFLHHFLAFCLTFQSYVSNYDRIGIIFLITHDTTDVFLAFTRAQEGLKYKVPVFFPIFFIITFFVWTYLRGIVYTTCELIPALHFLASKQIVRDSPYTVETAVPDAGLFVQAILLAIMNYYWIVALAQIFYKNIKGKAVAKIIFGSGAAYINNYDPNLLKVSASISAVK